MPLVKTTLEQALKTKIKAIEPKLQLSLDDQAQGIYNALKQIDAQVASPPTGFNLEEYKKKIWTVTSKEWSTALAKQIIDTLSEEMSKLVSDEVDKYIKSATIITPPGTGVQVNTGTGTGATVAPTAQALIS